MFKLQIMKSSIFILIISFLSLQAAAQKQNDTFSVYFELDIDALSSGAVRQIDSLVYNEKIKNGVPISIIGYADYLATEEYNLDLSRRRATNVKDYLIKSGVREGAIKMLLGKGEVKRKDTIRNVKGIPEDRRVDIVMEYAAPKRAPKPADTFITMRPSEKLLMPPSTDDPDFDITQIPKGKTFIIKNIYFPMGRHFPRQTSLADLDMILQAMKENPRMRIQIEGHVCCISNNVLDAYDLDSRQMDLSVNRARFVYEYLQARGIAAQRLGYVGYGKSRPIVPDEQTEEEAAINRRVEVRILDK